MRAAVLLLPVVLIAGVCVAAAFPASDEVVVDFENVDVLLANDKAHRVEQWVEKGVTFKLAREPRESKAKGLVMFFRHLSSGHKGIASAMALEPIPVRASFPLAVSSVAIAFWGSTGTPALLEAFDTDGKVVDRASVASVPGRKSPGDPVPVFTLTVRAQRIAYIEFSGPRGGEFLAADEVRFTPVENTGR
jgi:hypothetical protein